MNNIVWRIDASGVRLDFPSPPRPPNTYITAIASQPDGKVLVGGDITETPEIFFIRLNKDGSIDPTFVKDTYTPEKLIVLPDGKILNLGVGTVSRLLANGQTDPTFTTTVSGIRAMALQPDGKIVITGSFDSVDGIARNGLARLNENGVIDLTFNPTGAPGGRDLALQSDGRVLVAAGRVVMRVFSDGRRDSSFTRPLANSVYAVEVDRSDRIYVPDGGLIEQFSGRVRVKVLPSDVPVVLERSSAIDAGWSALQSVPANTSDEYVDANYPGTGNMFYRARPAP
ncbi:MAG TPA: hypothetical protein VM680_19710 [Verrucomicrobiae bacterium]|nr:hypothetical protein [Verrucomicrobiae bacterium]